MMHAKAEICRATVSDTILRKLWNRITESPMANVLFVLALAVVAAHLSTMVFVVQDQVGRAPLRASLQSDANNLQRVCERAHSAGRSTDCAAALTVASER